MKKQIIKQSLMTQDEIALETKLYWERLKSLPGYQNPKPKPKPKAAK